MHLEGQKEDGGTKWTQSATFRQEVKADDAEGDETSQQCI